MAIVKIASRGLQTPTIETHFTRASRIRRIRSCRDSELAASGLDIRYVYREAACSGSVLPTRAASWNGKVNISLRFRELYSLLRDTTCPGLSSLLESSLQYFGKDGKHRLHLVSGLFERSPSCQEEMSALLKFQDV